MPDSRPSVVLVYPSVEPTGGIERFVLEMARRLSSRFEVTVAGSRGREHLPSGCGWIQVPAPPGPAFVRTLVFALAASWILRNRRALVNAQGATCLSPSVVTAHSCHRAWVKRSRAAARTGGWAWLRKLLNPLHPVTVWIEGIQYRRADRVVAVSRRVQREVEREYEVAPGRISVCWGGVDLARFHPADPRKRRASRRARGLDPDAPVALFVANEFRRKGLDTLLAALARQEEPSLRVAVVGRGRAWPYREMARRMGLDGRVHFVGATEEPEAWYRMADFFVLPTEYEPFGLVVVEALASGLPVITSRSAGVAERLEGERSVLLLDDPGDPEELAEALARLADPAERARRARGSRGVAEAFGWDRVADEMGRTLASVMGSGTGGEA